MRKSRAILVGLFPLLMIVGLVGVVGALTEEEISLEDLPASVRSTIEQHAAGGQIVEVEREVEDGVIIYEAEILKDGVESDIRVSADGQFLGVEQEDTDDDEGEEAEDDDDEGDEDEAEEDDDDDDDELVALEDLPASVRSTIEQHAAGGRIVEIEREVEDGAVVYEAEILKDGVESDIEVAADGQFLGVEEEDADDDEDEEDDDDEDDDDEDDDDEGEDDDD